MKLVSVIIPTYNYAHFISEAIESVLHQTYPVTRIEIIVIDDGSTDNTRQVLNKYIVEGSIKYFYQRNKGKANATRQAIHVSNGDYIFNLDADDVYFPNKIAESIFEFERNEDIVHVASPAKLLYHDLQKCDVEKLPSDILNKPLDGKWLLDYFYKRGILFGGGSTYAARSSVLKRIVIPDAVDMYIDEFLIIALLPYGKSFIIEEPLSTWRIHTSNYSGANDSTEKRAVKAQRLLSSSAAVLKYVNENEFTPFIKNIYQLQDSTRRISVKETERQKTLKDILHYASEVFFKIKPGWKQIKNYYVLNRLIPTLVLIQAKKWKKIISS